MAARPTLVALRRSHRPDKKFDAVFETRRGAATTTKVVPFGAAGYQDYTQHRDPKRRSNYRRRHAHDRLSDPTSAGALSWHLLWGDSTDMRSNLAAYRRRYGV